MRRENHALTLPDLVPEKPEATRLIAQSGSLEVLERALASGADGAVYAPEDVRPEALSALDLSPFRGRLSLALPAVLSGDALQTLHGWATAHADELDATYLSNIGQLGLRWPGRRVGDYMLNVGNNLTVRQLMDWGLDGVTPSVELNAGQIAPLGGERSLILWGRIPLMHLRHCPLRATRGMKGPHRDCPHCDVCAETERLNGRTLVDRKGVAFPLNRVAMEGGCVIQVLNSAALMPLRRLNRLPGAAEWRLLLRQDEPVEAVTKVYRAALNGEDFRALPEWAIIEDMNTTTGHYFRGVE